MTLPWGMRILNLVLTWVNTTLGELEEMPDGKVVYTGVFFHDLRRSAIMLITQGGIGLAESGTVIRAEVVCPALPSGKGSETEAR
jgi:hypothetical protein